MKILVTGGAGFIASHIIDLYIKEGHEVIVIDDLSSGKKEQVNPKAKFYQVEIQEERLREIIQKEKPEVINHHAAQISVRDSVNDPIFDAKVNILGLLNLMEAAKESEVKNVIFASSGGAIYGEADQIPTPEKYDAFPLSPYGAAKLSSEKYLYFYYKNYGIPYIVLRYANVYGPRQDPHGEAGVVAIFSQKMLAGKQPIINGDGKQTRDYVYVSDVAAANLDALYYHYVEGGSIRINIATSKETSVNEIFQLIKEAVGSDVKEKHGPTKPGEQARSALDITIAKKMLDWEPKVDLKQGIQKTVQYFKQKQ